MPAPSTPRLAQLGFLVVAGFLLVNKVYSPQYVLWLLPLAALARPRWRDQIVWQASEIVYFASVWWYLDGALQPGGGQDVGFYWVAILVRMAGELYLCAMVVRDILRPRYDVARQPDDPPPQAIVATRSNGVVVWRTRASTRSPTFGSCASDGHEQHRHLHVRRLGEPALLAVHPERRARQVDGCPGRRGPRWRRAASRPLRPWGPPGRSRGRCRR